MIARRKIPSPFSLFIFSLLFLSFGGGGYFLFLKEKKRRMENPAFFLEAIVQTGPEKEALKTTYLAELLSLSKDHPTSIYAIDLKEAEKKLLASPLIAKAKVSRLPPNVLYIDYEVRRPVAWLADYQNTAIDREGHLFPVHPFLSPKKLPEIYLGLPSFGAEADPLGREGGSFAKPLSNRYFSLALEILSFLEEVPWKEGLRICRIDVGSAFASTLGQREVVLFTEEDLWVKRGKGEMLFTFPKILRLAPKDYEIQLNHFFTLRRNMAEDYGRQLAKAVDEGTSSGRFAPRIIDLRIPQLAFIDNR